MKTYLMVLGTQRVKLKYGGNNWNTRGTCIESNTKAFSVGETYSYFQLTDLTFKGWVIVKELDSDFNNSGE